MGSTGPTVTGRNTREKKEMRKIFLFFAVCSFVGTVSSHPRGLPEMVEVEARTACSIDDLLKCQEEINQAMSDCGHLDTLAEITTCINDILTGLPDCQRCVCDALPQLCGI